MDKVEIRDDQVLSMDAIAAGVHGLRITFVNVFGFENGGWTSGPGAKITING
jgi:hypothetical protein